MNKSRSGFTLLEVLIAMSILSIMLVLLFGSFAICSRSWNVGEEHIHKVEQMAMVQNFFRTRLSTAGVDQNAQTDDSEEDVDTDSDTLYRQKTRDDQTFFQGREQYLQFVSLLPESAARGGWYLFKVSVKTNTSALFVEMTPFLPFRDRQQPEPEELEILTDLERLSIAYWGKKEDEEAPSWHTEWLDMPVLPELVSINITLRDQTPWPTLVVAPRLAPVTPAGSDDGF
ncbi:MAG: prepilin-type N-terminal cleavage/methylation domain-containing protein [Gammaproteobacteria bacterium]